MAYLDEQGLRGATVLEVGGGVGEIQIELLKRGAVRAVNLELSPAYEDEAQRLLADAGVGDRVDRRLHDLAVDPGSVGPADLVVLHRVVCCYPDFERLLAAAAGKARRALVFSFPRRNAGSRAFIALQNLRLRATGREFRTFAHPPRAMLDVVAAGGLEGRISAVGPVWLVAGAQRPAAKPWRALS